VILGNSIRCLELSKAMLARGVSVQPILHPAVEESASRLRYFITSDTTSDSLDILFGRWWKSWRKSIPVVRPASKAGPRWPAEQVRCRFAY